jgi:hypothetical protein
MKRALVLLLALLLSAVVFGCGSTVTRVQKSSPPRLKARWAMLPFINHSETPQAGERVEAMLGTVLRAHGVGLDTPPAAKEDEARLTASDRQKYEESLTWARGQKYDYVVGGSVEEWRYKSGLDGEPAIGVTVLILDVAQNRVVWSASGTRTGTAGDNTSGTALKLLDTLVEQLDVAP